MSNNPQHQLTGSEELERIIARYINRQHWAGSVNRIREELKTDLNSWHTKHLAKARVEAKIEALEQQQRTSWVTNQLYGGQGTIQLKTLIKLNDDLITDLKSQLASMEKTE